VSAWSQPYSINIVGCTDGTIKCGSDLGTGYTADHEYKCISNTWADQGTSPTCATGFNVSILLIAAIGLILAGAVVGGLER